MEKIIKNEYMKNLNREKIFIALKMAGFTEREHALSKVGWFEDLIYPDNNKSFGFISKYRNNYWSSIYRVGYEIIYDYDFTDTITILIHIYPGVCYEFTDIKVPDEIMLDENVKEIFINFLDEKLKTVHDNIDIAGYQRMADLLS